MKKRWEEPKIMVQKFMPNEYVAACGDSGTVYKFECTAGDDSGGYSVYLNGKDGIAHTEDDIFEEDDFDLDNDLQTVKEREYVSLKRDENL